MKGQERCGTGQCGSQHHSRGGGAAGGATQPSDELAAGEIAEFGAEESEELAAELLGEAGV